MSVLTHPDSRWRAASATLFATLACACSSITGEQETPPEGALPADLVKEAGRAVGQCWLLGDPDPDGTQPGDVASDERARERRASAP